MITKYNTSNEWKTPVEFYDCLAMKFGPFTLDAAASSGSMSMVPSFISPEENGLKVSWGDKSPNGRVWNNPPYSSDRRNPTETDLWAMKAVHETLIADPGVFSVTQLMPAKVELNWYHNLALECAKYILFIRGRLSFSGEGSFRQANVVIHYQRDYVGEPMIGRMQRNKADNSWEIRV